MMCENIQRAVRDAGLEEVSEEALKRFDEYLALLLKWNSRLNLTAIRKPGDIVRRHFVECIQCAQVLPKLPPASTLLDFGSGAGLPGIPIAICRKDLRVTLAESQRKKAAFLLEAVRALGIEAEVYDGRVEEMPPEKLFDLVTLRAVDKMSEASKAALSRLVEGGYMVLFTTESHEAGAKSALPEVSWRSSIPTVGLERGRILVGQRLSV